MTQAGRIDRAELLIRAPASRLFSCWTDPALLVHWLPPAGMSARVTHFDARPGGAFRLVLSYEDPAIAGKSGGGEDVIAAEFTALTPPSHLAFVSRFASDDPAFAGQMRMDWHFIDTNGATLVRISASHVPPGISQSDHEDAMRASLSQLAALVE